MSPKDYCHWCSATHEGMSCERHEAARRQYYIDNPHSCAQCR